MTRGHWIDPWLVSRGLLVVIAGQAEAVHGKQTDDTVIPPIIECRLLVERRVVVRIDIVKYDILAHLLLPDYYYHAI